MIHTITGSDLRHVLHYRMLIERLRQAFRAGNTAPPRCVYSVPTHGPEFTQFSLAAAWKAGQAIGVRLYTEFSENPQRYDLPAEIATYVLLDGRNGVPLAILDGLTLTQRRAAAVSALAASYLARPDSERLLVLGTGSMAVPLIEAFAEVLPSLAHVLVWGRDRTRAEKVAARFKRQRFKVAVTEDLEGAVRGAHVITSATRCREPLIRGAWLPDGVHVDLVGSLVPETREADDAVLQRSRIFVDVREAAIEGTGEILIPMHAGVIAPEDIAGDLFDLARGERAGRRFYDQITLFKSVGAALADLTAAQLAVEMVVHNETLR